MSAKRVFVVTGSNKGIGKSIVKLLLQDKEEKIVYLTSRNKQLGEEAVKDLRSLNLHAKYHQLDVTDRKSIEDLHDHLVSKHGGFDVLVNNAGMSYHSSTTNAPLSEQVEVTVTVNLFGMISVCEVLFPILNDGARVVHLSSRLSEIGYKKLSDVRKTEFSNSSLKIEGLKELFNLFILHAKQDQLETNGWQKSPYAMSKVGVSFLTIIQQKEINNSKRNIVVNCCCPGPVDTDIVGGKHKGMLTTDEGADTTTFLALLPLTCDVPKGCYLKLRKVVNYPPA